MRGKIKKRILVVVAGMGHNSQREIAGISAWAKESGWSFDVVEGSHFGSTPNFAKWIDFWNPDGLVVDPIYAHEALADEAASALPLVIWDAARAEGEMPRRSASVISDPEAIADAAVGELLETGFPRFAYVPAEGNPLWSQERAEAFAKAVAAFGRPVSVFSPGPGDVSDARRFRAGLSKFLAARKKPCGVFAANDPTAALVLNVCTSLGLRVPQDIALLGVDDSPEYCERGEPTLSSIRVDIEHGGRVAAELLASLIGTKTPKQSVNPSINQSNNPSIKQSINPPPFARYGVERVVRRASTRVLRVADARVSRALEWIRLNACSPIDVDDVVAVMGCSRRLADLNFRKATGRSILDEIHARRLDEVKSLLKRDDIPIGEIPGRCGYVQGPYLGILFKRVTGRTMRQWRQAWLRRHE